MRPSTLIKQQKIIDVASRLFFEQGYSSTSMDQIVEQCGGSKQTLYRYFGDKKGILQQVVNQSADRVEAIFQFEPDSKISLSEVLNRFGYDYLSIICSPQVISMYRLLMTESRHDNSLGEYFLSRGPHLFHKRLADYLQTLSRQGLLTLTDPKVASSHFLGMLKGSYFQEALLGYDCPNEVELRDYVAQAVACFLNGYQTQKI
jgi:TetR/AcrR family transcriptional regulator, mexJK operon transcriptional repressor